MTDAPTKPATADDAAAKALEARREAERKAAEAAGRRDADMVVGAAKSAAGTVVDTAKAGADALGAAARTAKETGIDGMAADARRRGEEANKSLNIGSLLGGLGGLILAYIGAPMVASFLGLGDVFGTLGMIMMAIPMMIMGSSQFGGWINEKLGRSHPAENIKMRAHDAPAHAQAAAPAKAPAQAAAAPVTTIPHEALVAMLADAKGKGLDANHVMFRKDAQGKVIPSLIDIEKAPQVVKDLKEKGGVIPVTTFKDAMDVCQAKGFQHAVAFVPAEGDAVRPQGCVPKAAASAAR